MSLSIAASNAFSYVQNLPTNRQGLPLRTDFLEKVKSSTEGKVSISDAAKQALTAEISATRESQAIQKQLDAIIAKSPLARSEEETKFLLANDKKMAELQTKDSNTWTSADHDYAQKTLGFVNTMAKLTPSEKALYDDLVAKGEGKAASAMHLVGMARMGQEDVTLPNGKTFNPNETAITAGNLRNLFNLMFVDPSGQTDRQFEALAQALERRDASIEKAKA